MVVEGNTFSAVNGINIIHYGFVYAYFLLLRANIGLTASDGVFVANNNFLNTLPINYSVQGQHFGFNNGYILLMALSY